MLIESTYIVLYICFMVLKLKLYANAVDDNAVDDAVAVMLVQSTEYRICAPDIVQ